MDKESEQELANPHHVVKKP